MSWKARKTGGFQAGNGNMQMLFLIAPREALRSQERHVWLRALALAWDDFVQFELLSFAHCLVTVQMILAQDIYTIDSNEYLFSHCLSTALPTTALLCTRMTAYTSHRQSLI